jgi:hypothetical protein
MATEEDRDGLSKNPFSLSLESRGSAGFTYLHGLTADSNRLATSRFIVNAGIFYRIGNSHVHCAKNFLHGITLP